MTRHRSGAALIMAIVILAALLMLGLPFLFSQSASLSGTRSFAHSQLAQSGRSTAEDLGIGASYYIVRRSLTQGGTSESTDIDDVPGGVTLPSDPRRRTLDLSPAGHGFNPAEPRNAALMGLSLEDESGKLDPNHMDTKAWMRLFEKVGIEDWDDGDDGPNGVKDDDIDEGQLAYALASVRFDRSVCREGRITRFEQLLEAKPQPDGVRNALTRSELAQLIPFLTLASLGQGREGLVDLGTMIKYQPVAGGGTASGRNATQERLDSLRPTDLIGFPVARELIGAGSVLVSEPPGGMPALQRATIGKYFHGMSTSIDLETVRDGPLNPPNSHRPRHQEAVAIEIPAPVNIHETSEPVRWVFKDVASGNKVTSQLSDLVRLAVKETDAFNRRITGQTLQNPLGVYQVLGISTVQQTQPYDHNSGLSGKPPMPDGTLTDSATQIHVSGGNLSAMPRSGYARIESNPSTTSGATAPATGSGSQMVVEYISYNNGSNLGGGTALLDNVRRGLTFPGGTGAQVHTADGSSKLTFIAPRELPPLSLTSQGLVTIESGSSVADGAGHQGAQQFRRVVAQAVPQEQLLEMRWEKQSHYHALLVQRHGSLMNAFPKAYQRQYDVEPDNQGQTNASNHDLSTGVRPAVLRTLLTSTHLGTNWRNGHTWSRSLSMEQAGDDPLIMGDMEYGQGTSSYSANDLTPEGLTLRGGSPLNYNVFFRPGNGVQDGFFTYPLGTTYSPPINGRQFGLWIKPNSTLAGDVTLFELRSPLANAGKRFAAKTPWLPLMEPDGKDPREPGDSFYQNRITLAYEDRTKQLVLTIANGAIEHLVDYGPVTPSETFTSPGAGSGKFAPPAPGGPYVDPRSLGTGDVIPGAPPGVNPIAPKRPFNLVQHRYQLDKTDGLKAKQWHQIQVAFLGNDPGHMAIIVDGIVGRTMTRQPTMATMERGDHVTLPSLVLRADLPAASIIADSAALLVVPSIRVDAIAVDPGTMQMVTGAPAVAALLPKRGVIRVNNEFISYDDIKGDTLVNCLRARRQDSIVGLSPNDTPAYPRIEAHLAGALVVPGGIRFNPGNNGNLWKGGCALTAEFGNGDPAPPLDDPARFFVVWAELDGTGLPTDPMTGRPVLLADPMPATGTIRIKLRPGIPLPPRGYAQLSSGEYIYYDNGSAPTTTLNNVQRGQMGTAPRDLKWPAVGDPYMRMVSFEVTGMAANNYPTYAMPPPILLGMPEPLMPTPYQTHLVQLLDATSGRCEWIAYEFIDSTFGPTFFIDRNHFRFDPKRRKDGSRGRERTVFAGADIAAAPTFALGSRVIPVQTAIGPSHLLVSGDVMTIVPKQPGTGANARPYQVCVRFAATDGVHVNAGQKVPDDFNKWDTINRYFAFTEALEENWPAGSFEMMGWPAWSGDDLSSNATLRDNLNLPPYSMPLAAAFSPSYALGGTQPLMIGGEDTTRPFLQGTTTTPFVGVVDAIYAGEQAGGTIATQPNNTSPRLEDNLILRLGFNTAQNINGSNPVFATDKPWLAAGTTLPSAFIVQSSNPIFNYDLGLVQIGGEVFAYERQYNPNGSPNHRVVALIGRGLFGSTAIDHVGPEPSVILPLGPVARLTQALGSGEQEVRISRQTNRGNSGDELNAPAVMLASPDGKKLELIGMPNRHTASWLRGMYNTKIQGGWPGSASSGGAPTDTLVVGWWPRYPSAIPNQQAWPTAPAERSALLRCRMYSWMGFPIRFYDTWLTGGGLVDLELLEDGQGTFAVYASALDQGFDWPTAAANSFPLTAGGGPQDASAIFSRYQRQAVDGVEVRVRWEYRLPPADPGQGGSGPGANPVSAFLGRVATAGNNAPMLGKVRLRARAPAKILQVEEVR